MIKLVAFVMSIAALLAASSAQDCNNPLAQELLVELLQEPVSGLAQGSRQCPDFGADPVCCNEATFNYIDEYFQHTYESLNRTVEELRHIPDDLQQETIPDSYFYTLPGLQEPYQNFYDNIWESIMDFLHDLPNEILRCMKGLLKYLAGISCFLCDPNYADHVTIVDGGFILHLDTSVCTELADSCMGMIDIQVQFAQDLYDAFVQLISDLEDNGYSSVAVFLQYGLGDGPTDPCYGDCTDVLCGMVNGFYFYLDSGLETVLYDAQTIDIMRRGEPSHIRPMAVDAAVETAMRMITVAKKSRSARAEVAKKTGEENKIHAKQMYDELLAALEPMSRRRADTTQFEDDGYDAMTVGAKSSSYQQVEADIEMQLGASSTLTFSAIALAAVAVAALA